MIELEAFDLKKYTLEKCCFNMTETVFHVGHEYGADEDVMGKSYLWLRRNESLQEMRRDLWTDIQRFLPFIQSQQTFYVYESDEKREVMKKDKKLARSYDRLRYKSVRLTHLLILLLHLRRHGKVKLLYSDRAHAEMLKRCLEWLNQQLADVTLC
ncbi:hypothetical protein PN462_21075 [Spirulina sp. CS-785/01]|uniref:hypothetical protein n=1 Tax=Spirulina sp. CS-785/01 TaxID=3021716 RepID=UPI00232CACB4|nr:hypothetical protein [Spirulina sp. CS-785/01]MDB9315619.1 hypothetical protein [Spirulina sp. CS-785/01]